MYLWSVVVQVGSSADLSWTLSGVWELAGYRLI
jgi:hypothetical protein